MAKRTNAERLEAAKVSVRSALEEHKGDVRMNKPRYYGMGAFAHLDFALKLIDQLNIDPKQLNGLVVNAVDTVEDAPATSAAA